MAVKVKIKPKKGKGRPVKIKEMAYIGNEAQRLGMQNDSLKTENKKLLKTIDSLKVEIQIKK